MTAGGTPSGEVLSSYALDLDDPSPPERRAPRSWRRLAPAAVFLAGLLVGAVGMHAWDDHQVSARRLSSVSLLAKVSSETRFAGGRNGAGAWGTDALQLVNIGPRPLELSALQMHRDGLSVRVQNEAPRTLRTGEQVQIGVVLTATCPPAELPGALVVTVEVQTADRRSHTVDLPVETAGLRWRNLLRGVCDGPESPTH